MVHGKLCIHRERTYGNLEQEVAGRERDLQKKMSRQLLGI